MPAAPDPAGLRVLVVDDDYLVARALAASLKGLGCSVVGPVSSAEQACEQVKAGQVDAAILDVRLTPGTSAPVARALLMRGAPFVFVTGYSGVDMLPDDLRGFRVLYKPINDQTLASAVADLSRRARGGDETR